MSASLHTLSNGVRVVVDPMPSLETAALGVWAHAGSVDEREDEHGIAHLLEHMAFKGTATRTARAIAEEIEAVGGHLNAATSHQRTGYYARILKDDVALALDIIADILFAPRFDAGELAKEQEVVVQEIGEAADTPDDVVFDMLMARAWGDHPLARPILGTPRSVRAQDPQSLRGFMERCYRPADLVVAVAGNADAEAFLPLAERYFGTLEPAPARARPAAPVFHSGLSHDPRPIEQTHLAFAFPGYAATHELAFAARLYADALGGGMSSRLFQSIREERGLAYSVYAFADAYERCGLVGAYAGAASDQIGEIARLLRRDMEAAADGMTRAEIDRARALLRASLMMGLENPASRIDSAAGQLFTWGRLLAPEEIIARLDAVSPDDVRCCAEHALSGPCAVAMVGPGDAASLSAVFAQAARG